MVGALKCLNRIKGLPSGKLEDLDKRCFGFADTLAEIGVIQIYYENDKWMYSADYPDIDEIERIYDNLEKVLR